MTYQHQQDRAEATLGRIENLLAAILATLVAQRGVESRPQQQGSLHPTGAVIGPPPRIQLPPSYKGFTVPMRELVSNPQDNPGDVSFSSLQGMVPADDPRSSIDPRYRFEGPTMGDAGDKE